MGDILVPVNPGPPGKWSLKWERKSLFTVMYLSELPWQAVSTRDSAADKGHTTEHRSLQARFLLPTCVVQVHRMNRCLEL